MEKILCGVDLGGTKLSAGLVHPDGSIVGKSVVYDHVALDEDGIVNYITLIIKNLISSNGLKETDLEGIGVEILACKTCVEHFGLQDQIRAGEISTMPTITDLLLRGDVLTV